MVVVLEVVPLALGDDEKNIKKRASKTTTRVVGKEQGTRQKKGTNDNVIVSARRDNHI